MTLELRILALAVVLGLVQVVLTAHAKTLQYGLSWNLGPRDEAAAPLAPVAGRLERALGNFLETFPLFAAAVLIAHAAGREGVLTLWGTQLYFWARVAYVPLYGFGVPVVRTLAWGVAALGIVLVLVALA